MHCATRSSVNGFQEVVDHSQIEGLERVLLERRGQHEHRRSGLPGEESHQVEPLVVLLGPDELDIDEGHVDPRVYGGLEHLARVLRARHRAQDLDGSGRLEGSSTR